MKNDYPRRMVIWNIYQEILGKVNILKDSLIKKYKTKIDILAKNLLFNACGDIENELGQNKRDRISKIILRHIYGKDLDENALNIAKVNIWLKALKLAPNEFKKSELEKDVNNEHILPDLETNLIKGNSLIGFCFEDYIDYLNEPSEILANTVFIDDFIKTYVNDENLPKDIQKIILNEIERLKRKNEIVIEDIIGFIKFLRESYVKNTHYPNIISLLIEIRNNLKQFYNGKFREALNSNNLNIQLFENLNYSHWYLEFPHIFFGNENNGFDFVIGNPPYVFSKYKEMDNDEKKYYDSNYYANYETKGAKDLKRQSGKGNLFCFFLIKAIQLLKQNGVLGFIVPNGILRATTNDIDRRFILDTCKIVKIVDLGAGIFEKVTLSTILIFLQKERNERIRKQNVVEIEDLNNFSNNIIQNIFLGNISYVYCINLTKDLEKLFKKILSKSDRLEIFTKKHVAGIDGAQRYIEFEDNINLTNKKKNWKPLLLGRDISRYEVSYNKRYISYIPENLNRARTGIKKDPNNPRSIRNSVTFDQPLKIVSQRISGGKNVLNACLDNSQFYTFNSINNFVKKKHFTYDYHYFLALFNSDLINCFYRINYTNNSILTVNISRTFLDNLPIYRVGFKKQKEKDLYEKIIDLSKSITELKKTRSDMLTYFEKLLYAYNLKDINPLEKVYNPRNQPLMNIYQIDSVNSEEFNKDSMEIIKEYSVELLGKDLILILFRIKNEAMFKPLLKLKFKDNIIREYFFLSLRKGTYNLKNYKKPKEVFKTMLKDLYIYTDLNINVQKNVDTMRIVMNDLENQFRKTLTDLNTEIPELVERINKSVYKLYGLNAQEIDHINNSY